MRLSPKIETTTPQHPQKPRGGKFAPPWVNRVQKQAGNNRVKMRASLTQVGWPIFASNNILLKQKYLEEGSSCLYNSPQTDLYGASIDLSYRSVVNIGNRKAIFILDSPKEEQLGLNEQQRLKRKKTESIYNFFPPQPLNFYTFHTFPYT